MYCTAPHVLTPDDTYMQPSLHLSLDTASGTPRRAIRNLTRTAQCFRGFVPKPSLTDRVAAMRLRLLLEVRPSKGALKAPPRPPSPSLRLTVLHGDHLVLRSGFLLEKMRLYARSASECAICRPEFGHIFSKPAHSTIRMQLPVGIRKSGNQDQLPFSSLLFSSLLFTFHSFLLLLFLLLAHTLQPARLLSLLKDI